MSMFISRNRAVDKLVSLVRQLPLKNRIIACLSVFLFLVVCLLRVTTTKDAIAGLGGPPVPSEPDDKDSIVDVVDATDHVIGQATFADVHSRSKPLIHRGSHIILFDQSGRVLLNRRTADAYNWPSAWGYQGEHSRAGESYEACARRLLVEEMGLTPARAAQIQLVTVRRATRFISQRKEYPDDVFCWQYVLVAGADLRTSNDHVESSGQRWVTLPELFSWMKAAPHDFLSYDPPLWPRRELLEQAYQRALEVSGP